MCTIISYFQGKLSIPLIQFYLNYTNCSLSCQNVYSSFTKLALFFVQSSNKMFSVDSLEIIRFSYRN